MCSDAYTLPLVEQSLSWGFLLSKIDRIAFLSASELDYKTKTCCQVLRKSEISTKVSVMANV